MKYRNEYWCYMVASALAAYGILESIRGRDLMHGLILASLYALAAAGWSKAEWYKPGAP